jgi:hypothetical protein
MMVAGLVAITEGFGRSMVNQQISPKMKKEFSLFRR